MRSFVRRMTERYQPLALVTFGVLAVFVAEIIIAIILPKGKDIPFVYDHLMLSTDPVFTSLSRPWTLITWFFTYPKTHFLMMVFDLLIFWSFGRIFQSLFGPIRTARLVLMGAVIPGILAFLLSWPLPYPDALPVDESMGVNMLRFYGISGLLTTFITAVTFYVPNYPVRLFIFGNVKILWVGLVLIAIELVRFGFGTIPNGLLVILGGGFGFLYVKMLRSGTDISEIFAFDFSGWFRSKKKESQAPKPVKMEKVLDDDEKELDRILDKINEVGYDGLTHEEKLFLAKTSQANT